MDLFEWTVYGGIYLTGRKQFSLNIEEARHLKPKEGYESSPRLKNNVVTLM